MNLTGHMSSLKTKSSLPNTKNDVSAALPQVAKNPISLNAKLLILLIAISLLAYANTLSNGFVLDDHIVIKDNALVNSGIKAIPQLLSTPYLYGWNTHLDNDLYKPLSLVAFSVVHQFFGQDATYYHLLSVLLFAACVAVVYRFFSALFHGQKNIFAFIGALLFALHPIHTEVVANIKSCDELLCFLFGFLALNQFLSYSRQGKITRLIPGALFIFLSLMAKETSITLLAIIPVLFLAYENQNRKASLQIIVTSLVAGAVFLLLHYSVQNAYHTNHVAHIETIENALANPALSFESRIATAILIMGNYIKLLVIPYPLICDYSFSSIPYTHLWDIRVIISLAAYLFLIGYSIYGLLGKKRNYYPFIALFYLCTMALFTNIFILIGSTMAERFLFFGSVPFCLLVALLFEKLAKTDDTNNLSIFRKPVISGLLAIICISCFALIYTRNKDWQNNITLFKTDLAKSPNSARLNYYTGDEMVTSFASYTTPPTINEIYEATRVLRNAINIYPEYANAHLDIAILFENSSLPDSAFFHYKKSLALNPYQSSLLINLSRLCFSNKKYDEAILYNKQLAILNPANEQTYANISFTYYYMARYDSSIAYAYQTLAHNPQFQGAFELLASSYKAKGPVDSFTKYDAIATRNHPGYKL